MKKKYQSIAISCKAYELLEKIAQLEPSYKKYAFVSELIEEAYKKMQEKQEK